MDYANGSINLMEIFQLLIPVVTFAMGYYLTNIGYKRDRKIAIVRERFEKLYHPFYLLMHELGSNTEDGEGLELGGEGYADLEPFFAHLTSNVYLASSEGQTLFWETRKLFFSCLRDSKNVDEEKGAKFGESFGTLCNYLLEEYVKTAKELGYALDEDEAN